MNREQIYKAWQAVGADAAGLMWEDFVKALAGPVQDEAWQAAQKANADYAIKCATDALEDMAAQGDKFKSAYIEAMVLAMAEQPAQIAGFDVVLDSSMSPNTMKFVQPEQQEMPDGWFKGMTEEYRRKAWRIKEQPAPVQGWKMVPVEPTREIEDAIAKARTLKASEIWGDAIAAAPQPAQEPVEWMEMVVANLVREGVNKHKARELAQHFYTSPSAQHLPDAIHHTDTSEHPEYIAGWNDCRKAMMK